MDVQLELADAVLEAQGLDGDPGVREAARDGREQREIDRRAQRVVRVGAVVNGLRGCESAGGQGLHGLGQQIELELETAAQPQPVPRQSRERAFQARARIDRYALAIREMP